MLDYLRRKFIVVRDKALQLKTSNDNLKKENENQRLKDTHAASQLSFSSVNGQNKKMLKVNNMMMKENADLAKALSTSQKQIEGAKREINNNKEEIVTLKQRYREELRQKQKLYEIEVTVRLAQHRALD